jgi:hypothetical protein
MKPCVDHLRDNRDLTLPRRCRGRFDEVQADSTELWTERSYIYDAAAGSGGDKLSL